MKSGRGGRKEDCFYEIEILERDFSKLTHGFVNKRTIRTERLPVLGPVLIVGEHRSVAIIASEKASLRIRGELDGGRGLTLDRLLVDRFRKRNLSIGRTSDIAGEDGEDE